MIRPIVRLLLASPALLLCINSLVFAASLRETVEDVVETNPDVKVAAMQRDSVEQQMEQTRSGFFPQADISVGTGWEDSNNSFTRSAGYSWRGLNRDEAQLRVTQMLYDGLLTQSEFERQRARVNSHAYDTFSTAEASGLRAVEVYLNVQKEQKLVKLATDNLANHKTIYDRIVKRGESGVGSRADIQQALGRLALARSNLLAEQNRLQDAISSFNSVVGHDPGTLEAVPATVQLLPAGLDEATDIALDNHPRLKSADEDIVAAREQRKAALALFRPRVNLEISTSSNRNLDGVPGNNDGSQIMIRARYNLTGGKDVARRKETAFQLEQARDVREKTYRQVIESIQLSWNAWQTAKQQLEFFKVHVTASQQALESYRKQFNLGQRTLLDLLDQENEVFQASINYVNGQTNERFSEYRILAGTGKLLWSLNIPLPDQANTIQ